ncbi:MAG: hypothetical protein WA057_04695 [Candidatus Magasanikiibacteriota bacterium]
MCARCGEHNLEVVDEIRRSMESYLEVEKPGIKMPRLDDANILEALRGRKDGLIGYLNEVLSLSGKGLLPNDYLPPVRQVEIAQQLVADVPGYDEWSRIQDEIGVREMRDKKIDPTKAQWATVATTPAVTFEFSSPEELQAKILELDELGIKYKPDSLILVVDGCRVSFAFWKKMCAYKAENKKGCRFCDLSHQNRFVGRDITPEDQIASFEDAWQRTGHMGNKRTVVEILPDGSFLNTFEVPEETRVGLIKGISKKECVQKVAIETRPQYCTVDKIKQILQNLRPDQKLNIYFGLETTSTVVGALVHRKGYGPEYFKEKVKELLNGLSKEEKNRLELSVYNIIKPVYITEQESVGLSLQMARDMDKISQEIDFPIEIKYEPSVVSANTIQEYLYEKRDEKTGKRKFEPLSYFSVAELIALLHKEGLDKLAKFGQRDDIDKYRTVSMIPHPDIDGAFSQFDFMVYNAVQRFNTTRDIRIFLVDMKIAVEESEEFKKWEKEFYGTEGGSELSKMIIEDFSTNPLTEDEIIKIDFQKDVWKVADEIEYNEELSDIFRANGLDKKDDVKNKILGYFEKYGFKIKKDESETARAIYDIKDPIFVDTGKGNEKIPQLSSPDLNARFIGVTEQAAYQIEIILKNEDGQPQSLWVKIPLKYSGEPQKPDFIYS